MVSSISIKAVALAFACTAGCAQAVTVTVTPADVGPPAPNRWYLNNYRDTSTSTPGNVYTSHTSAAITSGNARSGNGSVAMSSTDGTGKADYVYTWGFVAGRTLGALDTLGFDWYRDGSSTSAAHLAPALRLYYDADGNAATTADQGYLIWEQVYNGTTASDQWVSSDILAGNFWQRQFSPGVTIEDYDTTLAEWAAGAQPAGADLLSANSAILGIEFGIGSGWAGTFSGYIDNVRFGFSGQDSTTFNFEATAADPAVVPEPASLALVGLGLIGAGLARRRRAARPRA